VSTPAPGSNPRRYAGYAFDLDGTLYIGEQLIPGAAEAVAGLRAAGARIAFLTNKPLQLPAEYAQKLTRLGIPATGADVVSSTDALLHYLREHAAGARLYPIAEPVLINLLVEAGFEMAADPAQTDVVVVSFDRSFHYEKLRSGFLAVRAGARIVATNPDVYCPTPDGGLPDCGALLAALEVATGVRAEAVVGKPSRRMGEAVLQRLGTAAPDTLLVGDRFETDVRMAREAGMGAALVLTGATSREAAAEAVPPPDLVLESVAELVQSDSPP
jgi:NagD protein